MALEYSFPVSILVRIVGQVSSVSSFMPLLVSNSFSEGYQQRMRVRSLIHDIGLHPRLIGDLPQFINSENEVLHWLEVLRKPHKHTIVEFPVSDLVSR